MNELTEKNW